MRYVLFFLVGVALGCDPFRDEEISKCREWHADILACKDEVCCKAVRARRPFRCWHPSRVDHPELCSVST